MEQDKSASTQFQPGQSGNPNGRPKGKSLSTILKDLLEGKIKYDDAGELRELTRSEAIALKLLHRAIQDGDIKAIREVFDRIEGKTPQKLDVHATNTNVGEPNGYYDFSELTTDELVTWRNLTRKMKWMENDKATQDIVNRSLATIPDDKLNEHIENLENNLDR